MEVVLERDLFMFPFFPSRAFFHPALNPFITVFIYIYGLCIYIYMGCSLPRVIVILLSRKIKIVILSNNKNRKSFLD